MIEALLAASTLAVCIVLLGRLLIGERLRWRFDYGVDRAAKACRRFFLWIYHWRSRRREAAREAEQAIRRARGENVHWDGNVARPDSLRKPRKHH